MSAGRDINKKNEITVIEDMKKGATMGYRPCCPKFSDALCSDGARGCAT